MASLYNTKYYHRDLSWLRFNHRVLQEAADSRNPLYERIKFLAIFSSNLDEFFRVRVSGVGFVFGAFGCFRFLQAEGVGVQGEA